MPFPRPFPPVPGFVSAPSQGPFPHRLPCFFPAFSPLISSLFPARIPQPPPGAPAPISAPATTSTPRLLWVFSPTVVAFLRLLWVLSPTVAPLFCWPGSYRSCRQRASVPSHPELGADIARNRRTRCPAVVPNPAWPRSSISPGCGRRPVNWQVTRKNGRFRGRRPILWDVFRTVRGKGSWEEGGKAFRARSAGAVLKMGCI